MSDNEEFIRNCIGMWLEKPNEVTKNIFVGHMLNLVAREVQAAIAQIAEKEPTRFLTVYAKSATLDTPNPTAMFVDEDHLREYVNGKINQNVLAALEDIRNVRNLYKDEEDLRTKSLALAIGTEIDAIAARYAGKGGE